MKYKKGDLVVFTKPWRHPVEGEVLGKKKRIKRTSDSDYYIFDFKSPFLGGVDERCFKWDEIGPVDFKLIDLIRRK